MSLRRSSIRLANTLLRGCRHSLVETDTLYDWQTSTARGPQYRKAGLSEEAADYLTGSNPRLNEFQQRYEIFDSSVTDPLVWTDDKLRAEDIPYFRGDNAYVWQLRGRNMHEMGYTLTTYYLKSIDRLGLLDKLHEDELFGNFTFEIAGKIVSRDLLDSINEIYFLEKHLGISAWQDLSVIDIGAGYGRLAHRMTTALSGLGHYYCTDAVAVSTFICEYYLGCRNISRKASVIPLDVIEHTLATRPVSLAVNVHSFSECSVSAIQWWLDLLARHSVRYLMVVPNHFDTEKMCLLTNDGHDITRLILKTGYRQVVVEPKYGDPLVQKYAINPGYYALFELSEN